jgi:hypothetical protein
MARTSKGKKFQLIEIDEFDARRGYKRCTLPGIAMYFGRQHPSATAHFWRDGSGRIVVRFICSGYNLHFQASVRPDKPVWDHDLKDFEEFIANTLVEWVDEGIDDLPSSVYEG